MIEFKSQTMRGTLGAMMDVMQCWQESSEESRDDLINPDAPMVVQLGDFGYEVQSIGGDGDIEGFVLMCKPDPVCEWRGMDYEAEFIKDWNEGKVRRVSDGKRMVPEREWQGLTEEDVWELVQKTPNFSETVAAVEAKLKEKNSAT